jgi:hypothetical protein
MCPSWLELNILTLDPTKLTQAQTARFPKMLTFFGDKREEIAHSRQLGGLLSERRDRPGSCGTGKQSDEVPPPHVVSDPWHVQSMNSAMLQLCAAMGARW